MNKNAFKIALITLLLTLLAYTPIYANEDFEVPGLGTDISIYTTKVSNNKVSEQGEYSSSNYYNGSTIIKLDGLSGKTSYRLESNSANLVVRSKGSATFEVSNNGLALGDSAALTLTVREGGELVGTKSISVQIVDGSAKYPQKVATANDLKLLESFPSGTYFLQTEDIDLSAFVDWKPIFHINNAFKGNYDGNGKRIYNLSILNVEDYGGLFGAINTTGTIKNIDLSGNITIKDCNSKARIGLLAGSIERAKLENITVSGTISATISGVKLGGVAGQMLQINGRNITFNGDVKSGAADGYAGGIAAILNGSITNAQTSGVVSAAGKNGLAGGVVAENQGTITTATVKSSVACYGEKSSAGGVCGSNSGTVTGAIVTKNVSAKGVESIAGGIAATNRYNIIGCTVFGNVKSENSESIAGGIAGHNQFGLLDHCQMSGDVNQSGRLGYAGGIAGHNYSYNDELGATVSRTNEYVSEIRNCLVQGNVKADGDSTYAGGIAGRNSVQGKTESNSKAIAVINDSYALCNNVIGYYVGRITADNSATGVQSGIHAANTVAMLSGNGASMDLYLNGAKATEKLTESGVNGENLDSKTITNILYNWGLRPAPKD